MMCVSALILTFNEELNLPGCLASLSWCDDVVVLDSYSSDRTEVVAKEGGAKFTQRHFDDYATQRNFGLNEIKYKHSWVLMVDADEVVPPELAEEIQNTVSNSSDTMTLYRMRRKEYFMGRWLRHSSGYPVWFGRLARLGRVHVERSVNEEYYTDGQVGSLRKHLLHYPFNKGFHAWIEKHNRYSTMESELLSDRGPGDINWSHFFCKNPTLRRKAIKSLVYRLPGRPILIFLALYIVRGGFLDGRAGLTFCLLKTFYEFMISCKIKENQLRKIGLAL